ncbi:MAG TPA: FecR domain-containing protein [Xanthobacteraceae bacterium]|nr:FecR domain-containing protein [Xanthobacteraceae bacterium]
MTVGNFGEGGSDNGSPSVIHADTAHPDQILIPDAQFLFTAHFHRAGPDLVLTGGDGHKVIVPGYFTSEHPPALVAPNGASVSSHLVELLAGSAAPNEYAQAGSAAPPEPIGRVEKVVGEVSVIRNGVSITLNVGDAVYKSDVVQTAANSSAGVAFPDGSALNLVANTRMALNEYSYDPNSTSNSALFNLVQGGLSFVAGKVAHTGDMKIGTPIATMGIRGTAGWLYEDQVANITANAGNVTLHFAAVFDSVTNTDSTYSLYAVDANGDLLHDANGNLIDLADVSSLQNGLVTTLTGDGVNAVPSVTVAPPDLFQQQFADIVVPQVINMAILAIQQFQNQQQNQTNPQSNPGTSGSPGDELPPHAELIQPILDQATGQQIGIVTGSTGSPSNDSGGNPSNPNTPQQFAQSTSSGPTGTGTIVWNPVTGTFLWNNGGNWTGGSPGALVNAEINGGNPAHVNDVENINDLTVGSGGTVEAVGNSDGSPSSLTVGGTTIDNGTIEANSTASDPTITFNNTVAVHSGGVIEAVASGLTAEIVFNDGATIDAGGTIDATGVGADIQFAAGAVDDSGTILAADGGVIKLKAPLTVEAGAVVEASGSGSINLDEGVTVAAGGKVVAAGTGASVYVANGSGPEVRNSGLIEAANGGHVAFFDVQIENAGGTIEAIGASFMNSTISLSGSDIVGGTLKTGDPMSGASGEIVIGGGREATFFDGSTDGAVTNDAYVNIEGGNALDLLGTIHNEGLINVDSGIQNEGDVVDILGSASVGGELDIDGHVILDGGGKVALDDFNDKIVGALGGGTLDNVDNTIFGSGLIGTTGLDASTLTFINEAKGVVDATSGHTLLLYTGANPITNAGLLEATRSGFMEIEGTVENAGGTIAAHASVDVTSPPSNIATIAGDNAYVVLVDASIVGGTLVTDDPTGSAGGVIEIVATPDANESVFDGSSATLTVDAYVQVDQGANLELRGTIDNNGLIDLGIKAIPDEPGSSGNLLIDGTVTLYGRGTIALEHGNGTISGASEGDTLINTGNTIVGAGTIENLHITNETGGVIEASGGALTFSDVQIENEFGTIEALGADSMDLSVVSLSGSKIVGGTIETSGFGSEIDVVAGPESSFDGSTDGALTVDASVQVKDGASLDLVGAINNEGEIGLESGATLILSGAVVDGGDIFDGGNIEVAASSTIGGGALVQGACGQLTVDAGVTLTLDDATLENLDATNHGKLQVDSGHTLNLTNATISGGTINEDGALNVDHSTISGAAITLGPQELSPTTLDDPYVDSYSQNLGGDSGAINNAGQVLGFEHSDAFIYNSSNGTFTEINDPFTINPNELEDGPNPSGVYAINDAGQVTGYYLDSFQIKHGFLYSNGTYTNIDDPSAGFEGTFPTVINNNGEIAGFYYDNNNLIHGFTYVGGTYTTLDDPSAVYGTFVRAINDSGVIAGNYNGAGDVNYGFVYANGAFTTIDDPSAVRGGTFIVGMNDAGAVVGYYYDAQGISHGFIYSNGVYTTLNDPSNVLGTVAQGIDDEGEVVGYYLGGDASEHGFIYSNGSYTKIDAIPNVYQTNIESINDSGQIAGFYSGNGNVYTFVDTPATSMVLADGATVNCGTLSIASLDIVKVESGNDGSGATFDHESVSNDGIIEIENSATLDVSNSTISGGTITDNGSIVVDGNSAFDDGVIVQGNVGQITVDCKATLSLSDTTVDGPSVCNFGTIEVVPGGPVTITGGDDQTFHNNGTLQAESGGTLAVEVATDNTNGHIEVSGAGSFIDFWLSVTGGDATISGGGKLEYGWSSDVATAFNGAGTLVLDHQDSGDAQAYVGTVSGITAGDTFDLTYNAEQHTGFYAQAGDQFQTFVCYNSDTNITTLTIVDESQDGETAAPIYLSGNYTNPNDWSVSSDGNGGIDVTALPPPPVLAGPLANSISDALQSTTLNSTLWNVYLPTVDGATAAPAVVATLEGVELQNRGYLQTAEGFTPTAATPLNISFSFSLDSTGNYVVVTDSTDGATHSDFGGPADGIQFEANWLPGEIQIFDASTGQSSGEIAADIQAGTIYDISITDNGSSQTFILTTTTGQVVAEITSNFTDPNAGNLVTFTERESSADAGGPYTATISNVSVSSAYEVNEHNTVQLGITDSDPTNGTVTISGLPGDLTNFQTGDGGGTYTVTNGIGTWTGTEAEFNTLSFTAGAPGTFELAVTATTGVGGAQTTQDYALTVNAVGLAFSSAGQLQADSGTPVTMNLSDGDAYSTVTITGLPDDLTNFQTNDGGGTYTPGSGPGTGTWTGTAAEFNSLSFTTGAAGTYALTITASDGGATTSTSDSLVVNTPAAPPSPPVAPEVSLSANGFDGLMASGGIVAYDPDGDPVTISNSTVEGVFGELKVQDFGGFGEAFYQVGVTPDQKAAVAALGSNSAADSFTYAVTDDTTSLTAQGNIDVTVSGTDNTGQPDVWTGGGESSDWSDMGNWSAGTPGSTSDVLLELSSGVTVTVSDPTLNHLLEYGSGLLDVSAALVAQADSYVTNLTLEAGASLEVTQGNLYIAGTLIMDTNSSIRVDDGMLTVGPSGTIDANVSSETLTTINTGNTIENAGTLEATNGAILRIDDNVDNSGTLKADSGGTLMLSGALMGTGSVSIGHDGILEFGSSVVSTQTVSFSDITGTLKLDDAADFHGVITNFAGTDPTHSDTIELIGYNEATESISVSGGNTILTLTGGGGKVVITLDGFTGALHFSSDENGDYFITDPPAVTAADHSGAAAQSTLEGTLTFADNDASGDLSASSAPEGQGYIGNLTVGALSESNGTVSVGFGFSLDNDQINLAAGQTVTQSYQVSLTDAHNPAVNATQTVSVSIGGAGNDNFVFAPGVGADTVVNFNAQQDTIELDHFAQAQTVQELQSLITTDAHGDAVINLGHNDSITFANTTTVQLQQAIHAGHVLFH